MIETLTNALLVMMWGVIVVVLAYMVARAASFAHFRTKLEYMRQLLKEMRERKQSDGKG